MRVLTRLKHTRHIKKLEEFSGKKGKKQIIVITQKGCESCEEAEEKGMCDKTKCVDIFSKKGKQIDKEIGEIEYFPYCVVKENGKIRTCTESEANKVIPE